MGKSVDLKKCFAQSGVRAIQESPIFKYRGSECTKGNWLISKPSNMEGNTSKTYDVLSKKLYSFCKKNISFNDFNTWNKWYY